MLFAFTFFHKGFMGCCCSVPRSLVSKKKVRTQDTTPDGSIDLDLTVIDKQIVCMGFPAEGVESWYRNPYDDVVRYLDHRFGPNYMVYNLCSESQHIYTTDKFHGRVAHFPFPDHHACPLAMIPQFIEHATGFLSGGDDRVVVVHCKAGKGRTGLMACCLLMQLVPRLGDAESSMLHYGKTRTQDGKGLTIPTQRRYVDYYATLRRMSEGKLPSVIPKVDFKTVTLRGVLGKVPFRVLEFVTTNGIVAVPVGDADANGDALVDVSNIQGLHNVEGDIRINCKLNATDKAWVAALSVHTLFLKKGYTTSEMDKLYKKPFPQDAGIYFEYLEVLPSS